MRWAWIFVALLVFAVPAGAQSLEERMKNAAGAYERRDFAAAIAVWRPLAESGNAEAQTLLGAMYWSGEGVPRDHKEAAKWYLRAAEKGYAREQHDIGEGVPPKDDVQAYKWLSLAVLNYSAKNWERRDQAVKDRAALRARMT